MKWMIVGQMEPRRPYRDCSYAIVEADDIDGALAAAKAKGMFVTEASVYTAAGEPAAPCLSSISITAMPRIDL